jgi:ABC-type cobalamin/Fe3+-siderophores transport system ATPase subunit
MADKVSKISKVEVKSLWNRFDLDWTLHPDVNVLSGINGSGKSTILKCIAGLLSDGQLPDGIGFLVQSVKIFFDNDNKKYVSFERIDSDGLELKAKTNNKYRQLKDDLLKRKESGDYKNLKTLSIEITSFEEDLNITLNDFKKLLKIDVISTFDNIIPEIGKPDDNVKTELDRDIFRLQKEYLDYQLNIGKRAFEAVKQNNGHAQEDVLSIREKQERFLEVIDNLFQETNKKINREKNEIVFLNQGEELTAYQLSSGEKQILVILLTALVQDNRPSIILMDEPEISLHFDWQKKIIQYIRELNPNAQIILATHSPAVIIEGWHDKVFDVRDLITLDRQKSKK